MPIKLSAGLIQFSDRTYAQAKAVGTNRQSVRILIMHMIIVTWTETRAWLREYGKPIAALWRAEADQEQYEYACRYASRSGYRVHTFPITMLLADAKVAAIKAHEEIIP
jgi:hypothetical protein